MQAMTGNHLMLKDRQSHNDSAYSAHVKIIIISSSLFLPTHLCFQPMALCCLGGQYSLQAMNLAFCTVAGCCQFLDGAFFVFYLVLGGQQGTIRQSSP